MIKKLRILVFVSLLVFQPILAPTSASAIQNSEELDTESQQISAVETVLEPENSQNFVKEDSIEVILEASEDVIETPEEPTNPATDEEVIVDVPLSKNNIYISKIYAKDGQEFIEFYNSGPDLDIDTFEIYRARSADLELITSIEQGIFKSNTNLLVRQKPKDFNPKNSADESFDFDGYFTNNSIVNKAVISALINGDRIGFCAESKNKCQEYGLEKSVAKFDSDNIFVNCRHGLANCSDEYEYYAVDPTEAEPDFGGFIPTAQIETEPATPIDSGDTTNKPLKNNCEGLIINEIGANIQDQFIEIKNNNNFDLKLKGCRIQTNRSRTKFYNLPDIILNSGQYYLINIVDTDLSLTKTTKGEVFIINEYSEEVNSVKYENLSTDSSWSLINGEWKQSYLPTPGEENKFEQYLPCADGYERNLTTGRCNKIQVVEAQVECAEGYYRSPETNRCRKIIQTASLVVCKEGYYRHPETNRCRKLAVEPSLVTCKEGYELNPQTNRCRKIVQNTAADNMVEVVDNENSEFTGFWVLIMIGLAGVSIILWEFREDIKNTFLKLIKKSPTK